ncbi:histidinol-phosphate/aromatic aminotransferase/cobyric acid decarboxylase-like protein [Xanthomonas arboricola]|uniref:hypothetical protein n=1 Tax=Xanthomonas arboricola TaxID=56448 RepID=UPI00141BBB2E|nr:hypothetical protein [Xanthomonas arboricola]NIJ86976.1 histidinol-phosphate/aromatic aminotransferase/cobyric acid decarboxylase-like protein [Xanthomonas arboricola]
MDLAATLKQVQEASPVRIAKVWTMPTCSERAACAAIAGMASDLGKYWKHGSWLHMRTDQENEKAEMRAAMEAAANFVEASECPNASPWVQWNLYG